ncbi:response regulator [Dactylosporangium sp. NPDC051541]|uniref:response regulator n=1 Tax=Dactylosporangium sp. NPDC051541 TaxID=3363977 RepID=UPI0037B1E284
MNRVLLVEDNPDDLELARLAFERGECAAAVDVARDGAEALEYLFTARPDPPRVVLLDIKLPRVDGIDVLRQVKADPRTRHIPVVMLTSSAQDRDLRACYELGVNSYIVKPVDMEQFMTAINNIGVYWLGLNVTETPS